MLREADLERLTREVSAEEVCRELIENANARGTADNLTVAFLKMIGATPVVAPDPSQGLFARLRGLFGCAGELANRRRRRFDYVGGRVLTCAPVRQTIGAV